jgi:hypothetical protein
MGKYKFKKAEQYAVWRAYKKYGYLCSKPIDFNHLTIVHIIPESISEDEFNELYENYRLPDYYEINSFRNWATSCLQCNQKNPIQL